MSIFVTGDTHIPYDISKLNSRNFNCRGLTADDYVIICGDFGLVWNYKGADNEEKYWLKWLNEKPFTTLFVDGNHECYPRLNALDTEIWHGGRIHRLSAKVAHLMRGEVFNLQGATFFTMGGASSHDTEYRISGIDWWEEEIPSDAEFDNALQNLDKCGWKVDYVITHCLPDNILHKLAWWYGHDKITNFLFTIDQDLEFKHWFCGHYHIDQKIDDKHTVLYNEVQKIL